MDPHDNAVFCIDSNRDWMIFSGTSRYGVVSSLDAVIMGVFFKQQLYLSSLKMVMLHSILVYFTMVMLKYYS